MIVNFIRANTLPKNWISI